MKLLETLEELPAACAGGVCMCIGMFDGVHRGHQLLMAETIRNACERGLRSLVFTFTEHPLSLLAPPYAPLLLSSPAEKIHFIEAGGAELCAMIHFTPEFSAISAEDFLRRIVAGSCQARYLACGEDFRFGAQGRGDVALLRRLGPELGFEVEICEALLEGGNPVRSTRIRQGLLEGRLDEANRMLGRPYTLSGPVGMGDRRGRTIGYPTANLEPRERRLIPANGVYAVRTRVDGRSWHAMMNIGTRPTFEGTQRTLEIHLFDFSGDLYGRDMSVEFIARIREERRFPSLEALVAQLREDEATCRRLLGNAGSSNV